MPGKPSYEELEQRNKELQKIVVNIEREKEALQESKKRFKSITNSIEELLVLLDQNFKVQLINTTLAKVYNVSLDEYKGKHCYELFYGRNHICEGCPAIRVLNEGKVIRDTLRYRPDGRIINRTSYPFIEDKGDITGVIVIGVDITQQKQAEEKLRESEEKYRSMMEAMVEPAYICSSDFIISYMNPAMVKRTGRDATGELCYKAINDLDEQCPWCAHDKIQNGESDETVIVSPKDHRLYSISRAPIFHNDGSISKMTIYRDITNLKRAEEALRESEERYRLLFEESSEGILVADIKTKNFQYANPAICRMLGYSEDELKLMNISDIHPKNDLDHVISEFEAQVRGEKTHVKNIPCLTKDGKVIYTDINSYNTHIDERECNVGFFTDITERKQAEETLRQSEERYHNIFKNIQDVYYEVTLDGIILEASPSIEEISQYKREEIIGKSLSDIYVDPKNRDDFLKEILESGKVTDYETLLIDKDQSQTHCSVTAKLVRDQYGSPVKIIGSLRNISERKRMEESLRQSESQKRAILDASIDRIRYIDKNMKIIWANKTTAMEHNMSPDDMIGHTCYELFVGRDTPCKACPTIISRETGNIERTVMYQPKVKGIQGESYWDTYCVPIENDAGDIESFIQVARNITEQKRAEEHINMLTQELMRTQENERHRISRDLHDHVAQELSSLKIGFETLFDHQPETSPEILRKVSELSRILQVSIKAVRDVSYDLRPPALDEMGLVDMLVQYCCDFSENNGINVDFHSAGMKKLKLDFDTEINLYRLIQEGLTNIKKHAHADHVTIKLVAAFPDIILRIKDNGKGFNVQKRMATLTEEKRMGIHSMMQRSKLLHGEMEIQSKPTQGTKICIRLPYKDNIHSRRSTH